MSRTSLKSKGRRGGEAELRSRPDASRFSLERIGPRFAIFDATTWTYTLCPPATSRSQAEQQCAAANGTSSTKRPREPLSIEHRFRKRGESVTFAELDEIDRLFRASRTTDPGRLDPDVYGKLRERRELAADRRVQQAVAKYRQRLSRSLSRWAEEVAAHFGYGAPNRDSWSVDCIERSIEAEEFGIPFRSKVTMALHFEVWPRFDTHTELRRTLALHYLWTDPSHAKAAYWGIGRSTYLEHLAAAHRWLALRWLRGNNLTEHDILDFVEYDDADWVIEDESDLADLGINKNDHI
jgi:hypothetical protein